MEVLLEPKLIDAVNRARVKRDWRAIARRIEAMEGQWQLIEVTGNRERPELDRGIAAEYKEKLRGVGCIAQVVALQGMNINQRPWSGWALFARIPRSRRTPSGKLI
jgi:hypothetical protein